MSLIFVSASLFFFSIKLQSSTSFNNLKSYLLVLKPKKETWFCNCKLQEQTFWKVFASSFVK